MFDVIMLFYIPLLSWSNIITYCGRSWKIFFRADHWVKNSGHLCHRGCV